MERTKILKDFKNLLDTHFQTALHHLLLRPTMAKNSISPIFSKERMNYQQNDLPNKLDYSVKKPWEIAHLDT